MNTKAESEVTGEDKVPRVKVGDLIRWTEEDNRGRKTYPTGKVIAVEQEHSSMKAFYQVEGCSYRIREDCARAVTGERIPAREQIENEPWYDAAEEAAVRASVTGGSKACREISKAYIRTYSDSEQRTAYVEWSDGSRTEGTVHGNGVGLHMRSLLQQAVNSGLKIAQEVW